MAAISSSFAPQDAPYPAKPIRLIVPFTPGAGTDTVARVVAQKLGEAMKATVVVENKTGAGGAIGATEVAGAPPDGYTLLFVASPFTTVAAAAKNPGYDPLRFVPVAPIAVGPLAFVVGKDVPANTMREFVALAQSMPGKLNYGSAGAGSVNHLALELLNARAHVVVVHVPYRGIADATKDLLGGSIQAMTASIPAALPLAADRRAKVLAVTGPKRIPSCPTSRAGRKKACPTPTSSTTGASSRPRARRARSSRASTPRCRRCSRSRTCASASNAKAPSSCPERPSSSARSSSAISRTGRS